MCIAILAIMRAIKLPPSAQWMPFAALPITARRAFARHLLACASARNFVGGAETLTADRIKRVS